MTLKPPFNPPAEYPEGNPSLPHLDHAWQCLGCGKLHLQDKEPKRCEKCGETGFVKIE